MLARASNLTKTFGGNLVFEDINFEIKRGDRIALIGENGSGKSTLFKIIAEGEPYDHGQLITAKGIQIGYLPQEPKIPDDTSVYEFASGALGDLANMEARMRQLETLMADPELYSDSQRSNDVFSEYGELQQRFEAKGGYVQEAKVKAVLQGLGFIEDQFSQLISTLSGGEKKLAGLAKLLVQEPDLILLDEPDNHLDLDAKQWLHDYISAHKGAVAVISHDRYFLDQFINHIFELEDHNIFEYFGNYTACREEKRRRLEKNAVLYELRRRELDDLEKSAKQLQEWASLNRKLAGRARNRKRQLEIRKEELEETPAPIVDRKTIQVGFEARRGGESVLALDSVSVAVNGHTLLEPFDLYIKHGERVGLVGPNGSGKTTLFRIIMGLAEPTTGSIKLGSNVRIGYYSQEQETLDPNLTALEYIRNIKPMYEQEAIALLRSKLLFDYNDCFNKIRNLSGGEKSRLQIMGLALAGANFLLLDEPTNNLDIASMEVLEDALGEFEGTIFAISHDRYFLDKMVNRIAAIDNGKVRVFPGNFTYYYDKTGGRVNLSI